MNRKKKIKDILFVIFLIILLIFQLALIKSNKESSKFNVYTNIAKWSFSSNNSETAIKLSDEKIYPGANGNFYIQIDATLSEIEVMYEVLVLKEYNLPTDMYFIAEILDEKGGVIKKTEEYNSFLKLASENLKGTIPVEYNNQKRKIIVYWEWKDNKDIIFNNDFNFSDCGFELEILGKQQS